MPPDRILALIDAAKLAGAARTRIGRELGLIEEGAFKFCWVVDFPMYEWSEEDKKIDFSHNPFSMPNFDHDAFLKLDKDDKDTILGITAFQYDIVCNGIELSSGAIRNHKPEIMIKAFEIAGYGRDVVEEKFGGMLNAFRFGAPAEPGRTTPRVLHRPFVPGVMECAVLDDPSSMSYATDADLGRWAVPEAAVFAEARQNLQARAWQGIEPLARGAYTLLQIASKDDYESSRAALPGWLASFAPHVQGVPICAFPERSALFVTGDGNPAAIAHLLALAHHGFTTSSRAISPLAYYAIADGRLVPLQLPPGHPVAGALAQAQRLFAERLPA